MSEVGQVQQQLNYFISNQTKANRLGSQFQHVLQDSQTQIKNATSTNFNSNQTVQLVKNQAAVFFQETNHTAISYVHNLKATLETQVAHCGPIYNTWQSIGTVLCKELSYPLQGTWLGMGWCLLFFIPAIIVCVKLAKYFRRMDSPYSDQYDGMTATVMEWNDSDTFSTILPGCPSGNIIKGEPNYGFIDAGTYHVTETERM